MTGNLDPIPDLVAQITELRAQVYELQRRTTGAQDPLSIGDMVDVQDDGLIDPTITKPDGAVLAWRAADQVYVPKAGAGSGQFPITDPVGDAQIATQDTGTTIALIGSGKVNFDNDDRINFNNLESVRFNNTLDVELDNNGAFVVHSNGGVDVSVPGISFEAFGGGGMFIHNVGGGITILNDAGSGGHGFAITQNDTGGIGFSDNGGGGIGINGTGGVGIDDSSTNGVEIGSGGSYLAFFGATPVQQQATPVTLGDVIALLQAYGLSA